MGVNQTTMIADWSAVFYWAAGGGRSMENIEADTHGHPALATRWRIGSQLHVRDLRFQSFAVSHRIVTTRQNTNTRDIHLLDEHVEGVWLNGNPPLWGKKETRSSVESLAGTP
jgi:hypothetical protein